MKERYTSPAVDTDGVSIPGHTHDALVRYIERGIPMGHFGTAVLMNDLKAAVYSADGWNYHALADIVRWLTYNAPGDCWGSPERVKQWIGHRGLEGLQED